MVVVGHEGLTAILPRGNENHFFKDTRSFLVMSSQNKKALLKRLLCANSRFLHTATSDI